MRFGHRSNCGRTANPDRHVPAGTSVAHGQTLPDRFLTCPGRRFSFVPYERAARRAVHSDAMPLGQRLDTLGRRAPALIDRVSTFGSLQGNAGIEGRGRPWISNAIAPSAIALGMPKDGFEMPGRACPSIQNAMGARPEATGGSVVRVRIAGHSCPVNRIALGPRAI